MRLLLLAADVVLQFAVLSWRRLDHAVERWTAPPTSLRVSPARITLAAAVVLIPLAFVSRLWPAADNLLLRDRSLVCALQQRAVVHESSLLVTSEPAGAAIAARTPTSIHTCHAPCEVTAPAGTLVDLTVTHDGYLPWHTSMVSHEGVIEVRLLAIAPARAGSGR